MELKSREIDARCALGEKLNIKDFALNNEKDMPVVAGLLTGSFIVESRFAIPGLGYYFVRSISDRDYTMIMGIVIFFGLFVVVCNLVSDILLAIVDPRVKLADE